MLTFFVIVIVFVVFVIIYNSRSIDSRSEKNSSRTPSIKQNNLKEKQILKPELKPKPIPKATAPVDKDPLKQKGDEYERYIGKKLEQKGDFVIYSGFIKGCEDRGVDLISISLAEKSINLVQCKNWTRMTMTLEKLVEVYGKLDRYYVDLHEFALDEIKSFQVKNYQESIDLKAIQYSLSDYVVRKTLYISCDYSIELEIGQHLTMMGDAIFKFKEMKIVTTNVIKEK